MKTKLYDQGIKINETPLPELGADQTRFDWSSYLDQAPQIPPLYTIYDIGDPVASNQVLIISGADVSCYSNSLQFALLLRKDLAGAYYAWLGGYFYHEKTFNRMNPFAINPGETLAVGFGNYDSVTRRFWYSIDAYISIKK